MSNERILIAEDDPHIRTGLVDALQSEGYSVAPAQDGEEALRLFDQESFALILLDIMMPGQSGYEVLKTIRSKDQNLPIIMLTAKGEEIDKVVGLELGADDYITKPFGVRELLARIAANLRRTQKEFKASRPTKGPARFRFGEAEIDAGKYKASLAGKTSDLTDREVRLLELFNGRPGEVLSRDELLNAVWGIAYYGTTRTLDQHIAQLRKKIEPNPKEPRFIQTVHGVGYRYSPE